MKSLTRWIVHKWIRNYRDVDNVKVRAQFGALESWTSIGVNLVLFAVKLALGLMAGSVALVADAINNLSDSGTSIIILIGFRVAKKPGDREHPFGHGRMESITTLIVAVLLMVTGLELLKSSVHHILHPTLMTERIGGWVVGILVATMLVKELLARFARELARMIQSKTLEADFWNHRSDVLSTLAVLAALGGGRWGYTNLDGIAGMGVALFIIYGGYAIMRDAIGPLLGERPDRTLLHRIETSALKIHGVRGVHDVIVHRYGQTNLISLHIEVSAGEPVTKLHALSERVEEAISRELQGSAVVHIDPLSDAHPRYGEIREIIRQETGKDPRIVSFHDLRIVGEAEHNIAEFDIVVSERVTQPEVETLKQRLAQAVAARLVGVRVKIKAEPRYAYSGLPH